MADILTRVNRTKVTVDLLAGAVELLGEAVEKHADLPRQDRSAVEARTVRLLAMLRRKGFGRKLPDLVLFIEFRLMVLARLLKSKNCVAGHFPPMTREQTSFTLIFCMQRPKSR